MPLAPSHARHLHLALADAASGTPRQWWHLEIAARLPAEPRPGPLVRTLARCLRGRFGGLWLPLAAALGLAGLQPYRGQGRPAAARQAEEAAMVALCLDAVLLGLGSLNASRQLLLIVLALAGATVGGTLVWRERRRADRALAADHAAVAAQRTPSEAALGLAALLVADEGAGAADYAAARAEAERLASRPDRLTPAQAARLGLAAPAPGWALMAALRAAAGFAAGVAAVAWPCWLVASSWQLAPSLLGAGLVHYVAAGHRPRWWRRALRTVLAGLACFAAGWLLVR
ncbi:hypothetical protein [Chitinimonas koreensis]|uniref:hypothetical protein n=1 Tax=Chitinimonas koreensis TaxID=356302 RepID=UPI00042417F0|nr:hypothetical protein [Chitinimonas koreensis]QNM97299.1 hypothetical protein H9L41_02995 [Chitinimonas koreensis]